MAGLITRECVERIRDATDIVALIESYVTLKRSGRNHMGLCPFHEEKTPSFSVNAERGRYKCFGCGESGGAFDFVMGLDNVTFREAAEILAERAGVGIEYEEGAAPPPGRSKSDVYRVNAWARTFFVRQLKAPEASECRAYLARRGINEESIARFEIGYAPAAWDRMLIAAGKNGVPRELLEDAGLIIARESGSGHYDRFRDRLIFPIRDPLERVVGFGGRCLDGSEPKYLNSPETPVFSKGRCLYGAEHLRGLPAETPVHVMEGYTDVVMAAQNGCDSAVATLGTALTPDHARMLSRHTERVTLVYDGDAAGRRAAERGAEVFAGVDLDLKVCRLPGSQDPCDFLLERGPAGVVVLNEEAVDFLDFAIAEVRERFDIGSMHGSVKAADELLRLARATSNPVKRRLVLERIAAELEVSPGDLAARMGADEPPRRPVPQEPVEPDPELDERASRKRELAERHVLESLIRLTDGLGRARGRLAETDFCRSPRQRLLGVILGLGRAEPEELSAAVQEDDLRRLLNRLLDGEERDAEVLERQLDDALSLFVREREDRRLRDLKRSVSRDDDSLRDLTAALRARHGVHGNKSDASETAPEPSEPPPEVPRHYEPREPLDEPDDF